MNELAHTLYEILTTHLKKTNFEIVGVTPVEEESDRTIRIRALQEFIPEHGKTKYSDVMECIVQIRRTNTTVRKGKQNQTKLNLDGVYLSNGKLNVPFLIRNADLLVEAGDYISARKIYRTVLRSGECTTTILCRLGESYEAEGKLDDACRYYEESIAYHPTLESYRHLASVLSRQHKDDQAREVLERVKNWKDTHSDKKLAY